MTERERRPVAAWGDTVVPPGRRRRLRLQAGESFSGSAVRLPLMVWRGLEDGPVVGITAAVHGDEINGTGTIRRIILERPFELIRGALILVPVVNVEGFERHSRYMPDRRDLNRGFPGNPRGSLSVRLAHLVHQEIVQRCDYLIDLHTAATRRTNFPNVRADLTDPGCELLARAFGCEVILDSIGPDGSLRREATRAGCPAIVLEAGEVSKVLPSVLDMSLRGISNVLIRLGLIKGESTTPPHSLIVDETRWVRAGSGGFLRFHVAPGDMVQQGQPIATNTSLLGRDQETLVAPLSGLILGMTTMPAVSPGDPVVHIGLPQTRKEQRRVERSLGRLEAGSLEEQIREHFATTVTVIAPPEEPDD